MKYKSRVATLAGKVQPTITPPLVVEHHGPNLWIDMFSRKEYRSTAELDLDTPDKTVGDAPCRVVMDLSNKSDP